MMAGGVGSGLGVVGLVAVLWLYHLHRGRFGGGGFRRVVGKHCVVDFVLYEYARKGKEGDEEVGDGEYGR